MRRDISSRLTRRCLRSRGPLLVSNRPSNSQRLRVRSARIRESRVDIWFFRKLETLVKGVRSGLIAKAIDWSWGKGLWTEIKIFCIQSLLSRSLGVERSVQRLVNTLISFNVDRCLSRNLTKAKGSERWGPSKGADNEIERSFGKRPNEL